MKDSYSIEEIIYGLREEYLESERCLGELKNYVNAYKKVLGYKFFIDSKCNSDPLLKYTYFDDGSSFLNLLVDSAIVCKNGVCNKDKNGSYSFMIGSTTDLFSKEVDKVLSSRFSLNIRFNCMINGYKLSVMPSYVSYHDSKYKNFVIYRSSYDHISSMGSLLQDRVPKIVFPTYHREILDKVYIKK